MFERGKIILVPFPFTDLSSQKIRPALILSRPEPQAKDVIVAFISSKKPEKIKHALAVSPVKIPHAGLKTNSWIRCDKLATLDKRIVLGELGVLAQPQLKLVEKKLTFILGMS